MDEWRQFCSQVPFYNARLLLLWYIQTVILSTKTTRLIRVNINIDTLLIRMLNSASVSSSHIIKEQSLIFFKTYWKFKNYYYCCYYCCWNIQNFFVYVQDFFVFHAPRRGALNCTMRLKTFYTCSSLFCINNNNNNNIFHMYIFYVPRAPKGRP